MSETPFKLRSGNKPPFKQLGSSPAKQDPTTKKSGLIPVATMEAAETLTGHGGKTRKPTYKEAWDNMSDEKKAKHGSYDAFEKAAKEWNASKASKAATGAGGAAASELVKMGAALNITKKIPVGKHVKKPAPAKDLGHGGHKGLTREEAAKRTHGGKMSKYDKDAREKKSKINRLTLSTRRKEDTQMYKRLEKERKSKEAKERDKAGKAGTKVAKALVGSTAKGTKRIAKLVKAAKGATNKAGERVYTETYLDKIDKEATENERKQYEAANGAVDSDGNKINKYKTK